jgi:hypothetical protein
MVNVISSVFREASLSVADKDPTTGRKDGRLCTRFACWLLHAYA